jgi:hypothetical protein
MPGYRDTESAGQVEILFSCIIPDVNAEGATPNDRP